MDIKSIATFVKGRMNKSVDERLVPPGEYVDALNVRLGATETTEIGAVENSVGNLPLTQLRFRNVLLSSEARCLGALEDGMNETMYWFVHDPAHTQAPSPPGRVDLIVSYNTVTTVTRYHVQSTSVLNFNPLYLITGVSLIDNLLFFTDDFNPPRKININFEYPEPASATAIDTLVEEDLSVIVKPPGYQNPDIVVNPESETLTSPFVRLTKLPNQENYMEDKFISFAYRYRYLNSEYSATSLFTVPAFQPGVFQFSFENFNNESMQNRFNGAEISFNTGSNRVIEVDVLYKFSNSSIIFKIDGYNKIDLGWGDNQDRTISFSNAKIYTVLGSDEILRLYDNVPRLAKAQTIMANRLVYGNYIDGYNISRGSSEGSIITPNYSVTNKSEQVGVFYIPYPTLDTVDYDINPFVNTQIQQASALIDLGSIADKLISGSQLLIKFALTSNLKQAESADLSTGVNTTCTNSNLPSGPCTPWSKTITSGTIEVECFVDLTTTYAGTTAVFDFIASTDFQNAIGTVEGVNFQPMATASAGFSLTDSFNVAYIPQVGFAKDISSIGSSTNQQGFKISPGSTSTSTTFSLSCIAMKTIASNSASNAIISSYEYFTISDATIQFTTDSDQGSLHSNRDYEVGLVYMDEYARASTVLVSRDNTRFIPPQFSTLKNKLQVSLESFAPYWAKRWKYVVKPSGGGYNTVYTNFFIQAIDGTIWCKLEGDNQEKVKTGDLLIVKVDADGPVNTEVKIEVLSAAAQPKDFAGALAIPAEQQTGFYMNLNPTTFAIDSDLTPSNWISQKSRKATTTSRENSAQISLFYDQNYVLGGSTGTLTNISIPAGTQIRLQYKMNRKEGGSNVEEITYKYEANFVVSQNFDDLYYWWIAASPDLDSGVNSGQTNNGGTLRCQFQSTVGLESSQVSVSSCDINGLQRVPNPTNFQGACPANMWISNFQFARVDPTDPTSPLSLCWNGGVRRASGKNAVSRLTVEIIQGGDLLIFETDPGDANSELFYDSSVSYPVISGFHAAGNEVAVGSATSINTNELIDTLASFSVTVKVGDFIYNTSVSPATTAKVTVVNSSSTLTLDADIFLTIGQKYTIIHTKNSNDINQDSTQGNTLRLPFINCYSFGNGVESFKILDMIEGQSMNLGERVLAVSNQEFKEANRFAGLTYSGIFSGPANFNNLNEFNLGLVNFKDCETFFGEIQLLHARRTDILVLQEDRISYVLAGKNILTDAIGGGIVTSVPEVLGEQVARIEEYGNSFNPESFAAYGYDMYFTDTKRGAVIKLTGSVGTNDRLEVISDSGMRSWFRDQFFEQLQTQKLGGFDPYMDEYVLSTNGIKIPFPDPPIPCGVKLQDAALSSVYSFTSDVGSLIGDVIITFIVNSGAGALTAVWNGVTFTTTPNPVTGPGTYTITIPKSSAQPNLISVELVPSGVIDFEITVACPLEVEITVIQVVLNAENDANKQIHVEWFWQDTAQVSAISSTPAVLNNDPTIAALWNAQTGVRSSGIFPYSGVNLSVQTNKINTDNFDFDISADKISWLSSNTLYANNQIEIADLLSQSLNQLTVNNPIPSVFRGQQINTSLPLGNQYLYLIYDLRTISAQFLCYSSISSADACCECIVPCVSWLGSQVNTNPTTACQQLINQTYYFTGQGSLPTIGDLCWLTSDCDGAATRMTPGYYKFNTNQVLQLDANSVVVLINNC